MDAKTKGQVYVIVIDEDAETTYTCPNLQYAAPVEIDTEDWKRIAVTIDALLAMVEATLPTSATGFEVAKARRLFAKEEQMLIDRMKAIAQPSDDELPF